MPIIIPKTDPWDSVEMAFRYYDLENDGIVPTELPNGEWVEVRQMRVGTSFAAIRWNRQQTKVRCLGTFAYRHSAVAFLHRLLGERS